MNLTLSPEQNRIISWFLNYDERFKNKTKEDVIIFLLEQGISKVYSESIANHIPLDEEIFKSLSNHSISSIKNSLS